MKKDLVGNRQWFFPPGKAWEEIGFFIYHAKTLNRRKHLRSTHPD